ncbi:MAG: MFS transporter [Panacagrimonas sp.]
MNRKASEKSIVKVALTSLAATSIEWYDFFIYASAAALVFPALFFPAGMDPVVGLIASFSTFAVGFLARPVGGIVFGHFGDKLGRKKALVVALLMMGVSTTLIGCLPTYSSIGIAAPVLLVVLRFAQGLAIGGQWAGAVLLITESAPPEKRGFYGSFAQVGAPVGVILANLAFLAVTSFVSPDAFMEWGWRLPFLFSAVLIGIATFVQLRIEDTDDFRELQQSGSQKGTAASAAASGSPVLEALRLYPGRIALAAGAFLSVQVGFYILIAFVIAYGTNATIGLGLPKSTMLFAVMIGALAMVPSVLVSAAISDRYGRRGIFMLGALLFGLWAFAMFPLMSTRLFANIAIATAVGGLFVGMMYGPQAAFFAEMFGTKVRYSGASLGYQLGAILGGALAPLIATALLAGPYGAMGVSFYMAGASAVTLLATFMLKETNDKSMGSRVVSAPAD